MSTQVVRVQGFSRGSLKNIGNEVDRAMVDHRNPDIDHALSHLNRSYKDAPNGMYAAWSNVLAQLNVTEVRMRKDTTAFEGVVVTSDKEFFEKLGWVKGEPSPKAVEEFFDRAYEFAKQQFGFQGTDNNFLSAKVHYDETTPHLQLYYAPITAEWKEKVYRHDAVGHIVKNESGVPQQEKGADGKALYKEVKNSEQPRLNRSEFWRLRGGKTSYRKMQDFFYEAVGKAYALERGEIGSDREHQTKAQWETKQLVAEKEQIKAEHAQLAAEVTQYRDMKVEIDRVEVQGQSLPLGRVVVKKTDLDALTEQAKAYTANRSRLENLEQREQHVGEKSEELACMARKVAEMEREANVRMSAALDLMQKQKELNQVNARLEMQLREQGQDIDCLQGENTALQEQLTQVMVETAKNIKILREKVKGASESLSATVKAVSALKWDDEDGYKVVKLTPEQDALIDAISDYGAAWASKEGFNDIAAEMREKYGISDEIKEIINKICKPKKTVEKEIGDTIGHLGMHF